MSRYLLIGCGTSRERRIDSEGPHPFRLGIPRRRDFSDGELYTLDASRRVEPDLIADLDRPEPDGWWIAEASSRAKKTLLSRSGRKIKPDTFDEVHAYEVLEHLGTQGDVASFFESFHPIWLVLKDGGLLCATVPSLASPWLWSDPGHRRVISAGSLGFLSREYYPGPPSSDYREVNPCDFELVTFYDDGANLKFILRAMKPAREVLR